jgi:hypothetical protein
MCARYIHAPPTLAPAPSCAAAVPHPFMMHQTMHALTYDPMGQRALLAHQVSEYAQQAYGHAGTQVCVRTFPRLYEYILYLLPVGFPWMTKLGRCWYVRNPVRV